MVSSLHWSNQNLRLTLAAFHAGSYEQNNELLSEKTGFYMHITATQS